MGRLRSALTAFALGSGLAVAQEPRCAHAHRMVAVLLALDGVHAEQVVNVLQRARLRMDTARRQLGPVRGPTDRLVMDAAVAAIGSDACRELEKIVGS